MTDAQFQIGDKAVYPAQGVTDVIGIETREIAGKIHKFYVLRIIDSDMKIMVPVQKAAEVGLRQVIGDREITEIYGILREKDVPVDKQTWNRRYRGFMEKIKTGSLFEVAEVYRDLSRLKNTKALSFGERRMLDTAKHLIVKEISVARGHAETRVEKDLEKLFRA